MKTWTGSFLGGGLFGVGLALSGMTDPLRVVGFLDLFGDWDATLAFVMAGALAVFALGYRFLRKKAGMPKEDSEAISARLIIGAVLFGIGWGLSGFCPGPALANLGRLATEAFVFIPFMALGMVIAQYGFSGES